MTVGSGEFFAGMGFATAQLQVSSEAEEAKKLLVQGNVASSVRQILILHCAGRGEFPVLI